MGEPSRQRVRDWCCQGVRLVGNPYGGEWDFTSAIDDPGRDGADER